MSTNKTTVIRNVIYPIWDFLIMYNDKRKNGTRRLKFVSYPITLVRRQTILKDVMQELQAQNITVISVQWDVGYKHGYGAYDYLSVIY